MTVGCRGLGDSDPSVTAESSASRREMAPSQVTESQRKDSQQKDSDPSWDKNVRTEGAPPRLAPGSIPSALHSPAGARGHTHGCSHSSSLSTCRFRSHGIPSPHNRDPGFSLLLGRVSTLPLPYSGRAWVVGGGDRCGRGVP